MIAADKLAEALALPRGDRAFLARELIVSLDENGFDENAEVEWGEVIERRSREMKEGNVSDRSLEEVLAGIRAKLHADRQAS